MSGKRSLGAAAVEPDINTAMDFLTQGFDAVEGWLNLFASRPRTYDVVWSFPTDDLSEVPSFGARPSVPT